MAAIVEDGSGVLNANSYATSAFYKSHLKSKGVTVTTASSVIDNNLVKATAYIDTVFSQRFKGSPLYGTLLSRSFFVLAANPSDGETVTVGSVTYTFRATASAANDIAIAATPIENLSALINALDTIENADFVGTFLVSATRIAVFTLRDGVATTDTLAGTGDGFAGSPSSGASPFAQPLAFPRLNLFDRFGTRVTGIPTNLQVATVLYAQRAVTSDLLPDPTADARGFRVKRLRQQVGPVQTETEYQDGALVNQIRRYPDADMLLKPYLRVGGTVVRS